MTNNILQRMEKREELQRKQDKFNLNRKIKESTFKKLHTTQSIVNAGLSQKSQKRYQCANTISHKRRLQNPTL